MKVQRENASELPFRSLLSRLFASKVSYCEETKSLPPALPDLPPLGSLPTDVEPVPELLLQAEAQAKDSLRLQNPGLFENAQNDVKRVLSPDVFDGCRFELTKPLGPAFSVNHTLWLGSALIPGGFYQFGSTAALGNNLQDPSTIMIGRMTPDGRLDARWIQKLSDRVSMRVQGGMVSEAGGSNALVDFDYRGDDFMGNVKASHGPLLGVSYFQSVAPNLALGGEGYYHAAHNKSVLAYGARYSDKNIVGIATYGSMGNMSLMYMRKLSDRVRLASEFDYNFANQESAANVGAEFTLKQSRFVTNIDHTGKISSALETKLSPAVSFILSAEAQHSKNDFKFGYGMQIGQ